MLKKTFGLAFPFTSVFKVSFPRHEVSVIVILLAMIALEHFKSFYSQKLFCYSMSSVMQHIESPFLNLLSV